MMKPQQTYGAMLNTWVPATSSPPPTMARKSGLWLLSANPFLYYY